MDQGGRLEEFVKESLVAIVNGCIGARDAVRSSGAKVGWESQRVISVSNRTKPPDKISGASSVVDFDVAVTTRSEAALNAVGKLQVWVMSAGGDTTSSHSAEEISRLKFAIPVVFPPPSPREEGT